MAYGMCEPGQGSSTCRHALRFIPEQCCIRISHAPVCPQRVTALTYLPTIPWPTVLSYLYLITLPVIPDLEPLANTTGIATSLHLDTVPLLRNLTGLRNVHGPITVLEVVRSAAAVCCADLERL